MNKEDYIKAIPDAERRYAVVGMTVEKRTQDNVDAFAVRGYAAKYNIKTAINNYFQEEIVPGFFDEAVKGDVRALFNHDPNKILARSIQGNGTLSLFLDEIGLGYEYVTPKRSFAIDLADAISTGDVSQSSFSFVPEETEWIEKEGELPLRRLIKCRTLYDVSPVTYAAYDDTSVGERAASVLNAYQAEKQKEIDNETGNRNQNTGLSLAAAQLIINQNL